MSATKRTPRSVEDNSVGHKDKPTLAKVKRRPSLLEATFEVPTSRHSSSDRSLQSRHSVGSSSTLGKYKPAATEGSASSSCAQPRRLEGKCRCPEVVSPEDGTSSTQSSSSDVSSSVRSELKSVSSASWSGSERSECLSKPLAGKRGGSSAATFDVLSARSRVSTAPHAACTETGESFVRTSENSELPATTIPHHFEAPDSTTPRHLRAKRGDKPDQKSQRHPGRLPRSQNGTMNVPKRNSGPGAANKYPRKGELGNEKSSTSDTGSDELMEALEACTPGNNKSPSLPEHRLSLVAITGHPEIAITAHCHSKEQSSLTYTFPAQRATREDALEARSRASSLYQEDIASPLKKIRLQDSEGKLDATYNDGWEEFARNSLRTSIIGTAWRNPKTALHTTYNRMTWRSSEGENLGEHHSVAQERILPEPIHMQKIPVKECLLYPLTVCLVLGFILVGAFLLLPIDPSSRHKARGLTSAICVTSSCRQDALYLSNLLSLDQVDPCDDFYAFVCNRWTSQHPASTSTSYSMNFDDDYATFLENKVYSILSNKALESGSLRLIRNLHDKCMSVIRTEDEGWNPLLELLFDVSLEGFPLTPPVRSSKSVWEIAAKVLRKTGAGALLSVGVASHRSRSAGPDLLSVGPPEMLTASDSVDSNEAIRLYTEAMFSIIKALKKEYLPPLHALSIVKFASDLEQLGQLVLEGQNIPEIEVLKSRSDLLDFFDELLRGVQDVPFIRLGSEVVVESPALINSIQSLVHGTDAHTVMNYIGVRLMIEVSPFLPYTDMTDFKGTLLYGRRRSDVSRWQLCVRAVEKALLPLVLVSVLEDVKLHASLAVFSDISRELFQGLLREIDASAYFDTASKEAIGSLLSTTRLRVLGPDWINDEAAVEHHILSFSSTTNRSSLESYVTHVEHTFLASLAHSSSQWWTRSVFTTNCWSGLHPPTLYVPLLVFNVTRSYTGLANEEQITRAGFRMARCIFDMVFDLAATATNSTNQWLSQESETRLLRAETCMNTSLEQSSHRFRHVRGAMSVQIAYALFRKKTRGRIPALSVGGERILSDCELFFVYLMLQACEKTAQQAWPRLKAGRELEAVLRNTKDFSDAYKCRLGSAMDVENKCALW